MSKIKSMSSGAWVIVGVLVALIVVPSTAVAVTATVVRIKGSGGTAEVTANQQLLTTEAKPSTYQVATATVQSQDTGLCKPVITPEAGKALVVQQIQLAEFEVAPATMQLGGSNQGSTYFLFTVDPVGAANCGTVNVLGVSTPSVPGDVSMPLTPGYAIPSGYVLDVSVTAQAGADITAYGYSVPTTDVGSTPSARPGGVLPRGLGLPHRRG